MGNVRRLFVVIVVVLLACSFAPSSQNNPVGAAVSFAQDKICPDVVKAALAATSKDCAKTGRNQMCYGNNSIQAEAQGDASNFTFSAPGNIVDVAKVRKLTLGPLNTTDKTWGIALLRIQANLPDTVKGQNVTMLMFGDVTMTGGPSGDGQSAGTPAATESAATQAATQAATASAASANPMQAFYFRTGVGDPACDEAPRDGILVQTPKGSKTKITLTVDGAQLELGSTAFLQAQAGGELTVSTLEGAVGVTSGGKTETATAGNRVRVPVDAHLVASGPPSPPEPYDYGAMLPLPVKNLPVAVPILAPKPPANAVASTWKLTSTSTNVVGDVCPNNAGATIPVSIRSTTDGKTFWMSFGGGDGIFTSTGTDSNFTGVAVSGPFTIHFTIHFTSENHADGVGTFTGICSGDLHFTLDK